MFLLKQILSSTDPGQSYKIDQMTAYGNRHAQPLEHLRNQCAQRFVAVHS